jgi:hypothetical protein
LLISPFLLSHYSPNAEVVHSVAESVCVGLILLHYGRRDHDGVLLKVALGKGLSLLGRGLEDE